MTKETLRLTRRELYDRVWKTPVDKLAKELGMSGRGLAKVCERHGIPVPPRGYWARKTAGQRVKRPPLLDIADPRYPEVPVDLRLRKPAEPAPVEEEGPAALSPGRELFERLLAEIGPLSVPRQLRNPHRIIRDWLNEAQIELERRRDSLYGRRKSKSVLATPLARRRLRILDTLFRELERRGFSIEADRSYWAGFSARLGHDRVMMDLYEPVRSYRRRLTDEERAAEGRFARKWAQEREPTGTLEFTVKSWLPKDVPACWGDEAEVPLERRLAEALAGILTAAGEAAAERAQREEEDRQRREAAEEQRRREEEYEAERLRERGLRQRAAAWRLAGELRGYVAAVEATAAKGAIEVSAETLKVWSAWAQSHADAIDPLIAGDALGTEPLRSDDPTRVEAEGQGDLSEFDGDPDWFWGNRWWLKG